MSHRVFSEHGTAIFLSQVCFCDEESTTSSAPPLLLPDLARDEGLTTMAELLDKVGVTQTLVEGRTLTLLAPTNEVVTTHFSTKVE